jgi:hypothetical protein
MTDKDYKIQKKRIQKLIDKWIQPLGLNWWRIDIAYERERKSEGKTEYAPTDINGEWDTIFDVRCDHNYGKAYITCHLLVTRSLTDAELEESFVHELMHIFVSPMHTKQKAGEEELVATRLAKGLLWLEAHLLREFEKQKKKLLKGNNGRVLPTTGK